MIGKGIARHYAPEHDPPLGGYALLLGVHLGLVGAALVALHRRGAALGEIGAGELLLTGVATFKLSRTISKSWIGTAVRAPFTRYVGRHGTRAGSCRRARPDARRDADPRRGRHC
jgi:hypothetical protein